MVIIFLPIIKGGRNMYQTTIDQFYDFLLAQHHGRTTIRGYIRTISGLEEPPDTKNPAMLLKYVDNALQEKKELLSHSNFVTARASLGLFFFMMTGLQIKDFRKQCMALDQYDSLVRQYASYCRDFLNLTDAVIEASVRETKLFLRATVQDLGCVVWSSITAAAVTAYLAKERSNLCTSSIGVTVTAIRRFFRFLQHNDLMVHASILKLPLAVPNWNKNSRLPITLTKENQAQLACHVFPDTPAGRRDRAILLCFAELGLRCNEVANLQLEDIEWNRGTIIIPFRT